MSFEIVVEPIDPPKPRRTWELPKGRRPMPKKPRKQRKAQMHGWPAVAALVPGETMLRLIAIATERECSVSDVLRDFIRRGLS